MIIFWKITQQEVKKERRWKERPNRQKGRHIEREITKKDRDRNIKYI